MAVGEGWVGCWVRHHKSIPKQNESTSINKSKAKPKSLIDEIKSGPKKKATLRKEQKDQQNIIDHFINSESEIIIDPKKPAKEPQADLSKESGHLEEELISENLAMIFEKQGKPAKAIEIYKKLIWKFPQKKAYFASQIEKLKKG